MSLEVPNVEEITFSATVPAIITEFKNEFSTSYYVLVALTKLTDNPDLKPVFSMLSHQIRELLDGSGIETNIAEAKARKIVERMQKAAGKSHAG